LGSLANSPEEVDFAELNGGTLSDDLKILFQEGQEDVRNSESSSREGAHAKIASWIVGATILKEGG